MHQRENFVRVQHCKFPLIVRSGVLPWRASYQAGYPAVIVCKGKRDLIKLRISDSSWRSMRFNRTRRALTGPGKVSRDLR
jgi:hypothetical protein